MELLVVYQQVWMFHKLKSGKWRRRVGLATVRTVGEQTGS